MLKNWLEEKRSAYLYRVLAVAERGTKRATLFEKLAQEADKQAELWAKRLRADATPLPGYQPDLRTRMVAALVRTLGVKRMRNVLAAMKVRGMSLYTKADAGHPVPVSMDYEGRRHRGARGGGNLRAAVFGVNDGLVSNASLILGVSGANAQPEIVLLSGVAGLIAGACSMAAGEYVSVRSQRELYEYQIGLEREELQHYPEEEAEELALIYAARGIPKEDARRITKQIFADPQRALDTLAREELGLNPDELGSPWGAALSSFSAFAVGALIPLLPFLLAPGRSSLMWAIGLSAVALFVVGAVLSLFTGRNALLSGARMLLIGGGAGALTYLIGKVLGVSVG